MTLPSFCRYQLISTNGQNRPQQNNVTIENNTTAGFDVNKLAQFVKTSTDPATLEKAINDPANRINNLDLDKDGNIDYLKVEEADNNKLKVMDDVSSSESVTVASINVSPDNTNNTADLSIQGNPNYVGYNNYYHSSFSFGDMLLLSYLMRPHAYYMRAQTQGVRLVGNVGDQGTSTGRNSSPPIYGRTRA